MLVQVKEYGQTTNPAQDLQRIFAELLKQGFSYLQILAKYNMCKKLFKKGTPEFYACLGVQPPPTYQQQQPPPPPPQQQQQQQQQQKPPPTQTANLTPQQRKEGAMFYWLAFGALLAVALYLNRRAGKEEEKK